MRSPISHNSNPPEAEFGVGVRSKKETYKTKYKDEFQNTPALTASWIKNKKKAKIFMVMSFHVQEIH